MPLTRSIHFQRPQQQLQDAHCEVINSREPKNKAQKFKTDQPKSPQTQNFDSLLITVIVNKFNINITKRYGLVYVNQL